MPAPGKHCNRKRTLVKSTFRSRLLNGQTGDPALLLTLRWHGRSMLIDLGRIDRTPAAVLLPIERVFVSHAHMDHFMGFDHLLRLTLPRDRHLTFCGPPGLIDNGDTLFQQCFDVRGRKAVALDQRLDRQTMQLSCKQFRQFALPARPGQGRVDELTG